MNTHYIEVHTMTIPVEVDNMAHGTALDVSAALAEWTADAYMSGQRVEGSRLSPGEAFFVFDGDDLRECWIVKPCVSLAKPVNLTKRLVPNADTLVRSGR